MLFLFRRIVLQEHLHSFVHVFLFSFLIGAGVDRFGGISGPNQLLAGRVIHVEDERSDVDRGTTVRRHAPLTHLAARVVCVPLLLPVDNDLKGSVEIGLVGIRFGQSFRGQLRIDSLLDLGVHNLVGLSTALDADPFCRCDISRPVRPVFPPQGKTLPRPSPTGDPLVVFAFLPPYASLRPFISACVPAGGMNPSFSVDRSLSAVTLKGIT